MDRRFLIGGAIVIIVLCCGLTALGTGLYLYSSKTEGTTKASVALTPTARPDPTAVPTRKPVATSVPAAPSRQPTAQPQIGRNQPSGSGPYRSMKMSEFVYTWGYTDQLGLQTPRLRDDAQSSGKGVWRTHDIGIPPGTFGVIKGVTINIGSTTLGTPCALGMLSPGYYRNVKGLEWRFEVYFLPKNDATGWAKVLADQAQTTEHTLYQCPSKGLSEIPVFFSDEPTPFGQ